MKEQRKRMPSWISDMFRDAIIIFFSFVACRLLREYLGFMGLFANKKLATFQNSLRLTIITTVVWIIIFKVMGVYRERKFPSLVNDIQRVMEGSFWGMLFVSGVLFVFREFSYSRFVIQAGSLVAFSVLVITRALEKWSAGNPEYGAGSKNIIVIGCGRNGEIILKRLARDRESGVNILGFLADIEEDACRNIPGVSFLGGIKKIQEVLDTRKIDDVLITLTFEDWQKIQSVISICQRNGVGYSVLPDINENLLNSAEVEMIHGLPLIGLKQSLLEGLGGRIIKRLLDVILSYFLVIIFMPVLIITGMIIKLTSRGPVFFRQERIGYNNRVFKIVKFRTMYNNSAGSAWTDRTDPRITPVGRFLRKANLDELPQLFNVLKGDMSLVGPRPIAVNDVEFQRYRDFSLRHNVKPGMTGWAQINGLRGGHVEPEERIRYDLYYINSWSIWLDFTILLMTPFSMINAF